MRGRPFTLALLTVGLLAAAAAGLAFGAMQVPFADVLSALRGEASPQAKVLLELRAPRVVMAMLVGASLASAGVALQGIFRNPLADPGLIGISAGAALAAAVTLVLLGGALTGGVEVALPLAAFAGGLAATLVVYRLGRLDGRTLLATLLLAGVAVNAFAGALTGLLSFMASDAQLRGLVFWSLGSLGLTTWRSVVVAGPLMAIGLLALPRLSRALNALVLGEAEAGHLGFDVEGVKRWVIAVAALMVGASVAVCGVIGFVGLVVPHIARRLIGPDHRWAFPCATVLGATILVLADLVARIAVSPAELPIGVLTACLGAPFFLVLLLRQRGREVW